MRRRLVLPALVLLLGLGAPAAADAACAGGEAVFLPASGAWETGSNWSTNAVPNTTTDACVPAGRAAAVTGGLSVRSFRIEGSVRLAAAATSTFAASGPALLVESGGKITLAGAMLTIPAGRALELHGGTVEESGTSTLRIAGVLNATASGPFVQPALVNQGGQVNVVGSGSNLSVGAGTGADDTGSWSVAGGGTLFFTGGSRRLTGSVAGGGTVRANFTASIEADGTWSVGGTQVLGGSTLQLDGANVSPGPVDLNGTLRGSASWTTPALAWGSGSLGGTGTTTVCGSVSASATGQLQVGGALVLDCAGTKTITGSASFPALQLSVAGSLRVTSAAALVLAAELTGGLSGIVPLRNEGLITFTRSQDCVCRLRSVAGSTTRVAGGVTLRLDQAPQGTDAYEGAFEIGTNGALEVGGPIDQPFAATASIKPITGQGPPTTLVDDGGSNGVLMSLGDAQVTVSRVQLLSGTLALGNGARTLGTFEQRGGQLTGAGTLTVTTSLVLAGGIHGFADGTTIATGTVDLASATPKTIRRTVTTAGAATVTAPAAPGELTLNANGGTLDVGGALVVPAGVTIAGTGGVVRNRGTVRGAGRIAGRLVNEGTLAPGSSPGTLRVGSFQQTAGGTYAAELTAASHDLLQVDANATLGGTLALDRGTFVPADGAAFDLVTCGGVCSGAWATVTGDGLPAGRRLVPSYGAAFARVTALDVTAPETTLDGPAGSTDDPTPTFTFTSDEAGSSFTCSLDGAPATSCTSPLTLPELPDGEHTLRVTSVDPAGNADTSPAVRTFTVARPVVAPPITTTEPPVTTTPPPPPPAADPFQTLDAPALALACTDEQVKLIDVVPGPKGKVTVSGAAATTLAGTEVTIVQDRTKTVGRATVAADGAFSATVPAPKGRAALKARYEVRAGTVRSRNLKLSRRMLVTSIAVSGGTVQLRGRVLPPLASKPARIVIRRQTSCSSFEAVATVTAKRDGSFTALLPLPPAPAVAAVYRAETSVPNRVGAKRLRPTFTLPRPVDVR